MLIYKNDTTIIFCIPHTMSIFVRLFCFLFASNYLRAYTQPSFPCQIAVFNAKHFASTLLNNYFVHMPVSIYQNIANHLPSPVVFFCSGIPCQWWTNTGKHTRPKSVRALACIYGCVCSATVLKPGSFVLITHGKPDLFLQNNKY